MPSKPSQCTLTEYFSVITAVQALLYSITEKTSLKLENPFIFCRIKERFSVILIKSLNFALFRAVKGKIFPYSCRFSPPNVQ